MHPLIITANNKSSGNTNLFNSLTIVPCYFEQNTMPMWSLNNGVKMGGWG